LAKAALILENSNIFVNQSVSVISDFFISIFNSKLAINLGILKGFRFKVLIINLIKPFRNYPHPSPCPQVNSTRSLKSHLSRDNDLMKKEDLSRNLKMNKPQKPLPISSLQLQNNLLPTPS
jgi:hypothetical protein